MNASIDVLSVAKYSSIFLNTEGALRSLARNFSAQLQGHKRPRELGRERSENEARNLGLTSAGIRSRREEADERGSGR